jgi:hypothetical protein
MSGRFDPTRTSTVEITKAQVARRVNFISSAKMPEDGSWDWWMEPHNQAEPPELVSLCALAEFRLATAWPAFSLHSFFFICLQLFDRQGFEDGDLAQKVWTADHVDPADQADNDDLPEAADQGGQGEHNPPPSPEQQQEDEPATPAASPIRAVPLTARPPSTSTTSSSAPKGKKWALGRSTAALEARVQKQRRMGPKKVPEAAG